MEVIALRNNEKEPRAKNQERYKMGDISVMARRLADRKSIQYGWSGNGGYFSNVGSRLLCWYNDPEKIDYLFSLGQLGLIGKPGSENGGEAWIL